MLCYNIYRSDIIKSKASLTEILQNLSEILSKDPNNLQVYKDLASIFSMYKRDEEQINENLSRFNTELIQDNRKRLETHSETITNLNRSERISIDKNNAEIKKIQEQAEENIQFLRNEISTTKKVYLENIDLAKTKHERELREADTAYEEEISSIDRELKDLREEYRVIIQKIDRDKNLKLDLINNEYNEVKDSVENHIATLRKEADAEVEIIVEDNQTHRKDTDINYLTIKKTHTQTSIKFNEFINKRKKETNNNIDALKKDLEKALLPFEEDIANAKKVYEDELDKIQKQYAATIQTLNIQFDIQKDEYNKTTGLIIKNNADEISSLNSEFSALTKSIENTKREISNEQKKLLLQKDIDDKTVDEINLDYKRKINQANLNLTNAIKANKKAVLELEAKLQEDLFIHDSKHIEQINDWRFNKNVYDFAYAKNNEIAKNKYNLKLEEISNKKTLIKFILNKNIEIQNIMMEKDLLPIEAQLTLSSLVQEREINLLNTEDQASNSMFKLSKEIIYNNFFLNELALRYEISIATEKKRFKTALIGINTQLQLEQESLKRDQNLYILNLNKKLQVALKDQIKKIETIKKDTAVSEANYNINSLDARTTYETKKIRKEVIIELEKRQTIIHEIKIKMQRQILSSQTKRNIYLAENDANFHEKVNNDLFDKLYLLHEITKRSIDSINTLFEIPAHPETFRQFLTNFIALMNYIDVEFEFLITKYNKISSDLFDQQINNITEHKYRVKHEEIINIYSNNISQIEAKREELFKQYEDLKEQLELIEKKRVLNTSLIQNYIQTNKYEKSRNKRQIIKYNKIQIKVLKDGLKLLEKNQNENDREMIRLSNKVIPLTNQIKNIEKRQKKAEKHLNKIKLKEEFKYLKLQEKHKDIFASFLNNTKKTHNILLNTLNILIQKPYISNSFFTYQMEKIKKNLNVLINHSLLSEQKLLSNWLDLYSIIEKDQTDMFTNFEKSSEYAILRLRKTQEKFLLGEEKEKIDYSKDYLENTHLINTLITSNNTLMKDNIKNYQATYRKIYEATEADISNNKNKVASQIKVITENLKGVDEDINKRHQLNLIKLRKKFKKEQEDFKKIIASKEAELMLADKRNLVKTHDIISKYEIEKERHMKQMTLEVNKLKADIKAINNTIDNESNKVSEQIKIRAKENTLKTKSIKDKINNYKKSSRKEHNVMIKKEKKTLYNSYKFKKNELNQK